MGAFEEIALVVVFFATIVCVLAAPRVPIPLKAPDAASGGRQLLRRLLHNPTAQPAMGLTLDLAVAPLLALALLLAMRVLRTADLRFGVVGNDETKPYAIVLVFFGFAYLCVSLDATGLLVAIARWATRTAGRRPRRMFFATFLLSASLTMATSNDIVILTLTPIVLRFCVELDLDPKPLLFCVFHTANIWSAMLLVGNPTNIIVAEGFDVSFAAYSKWMTLPSLAGGLASLGMLLAAFGGRLGEVGGEGEVAGEVETVVVDASLQGGQTLAPVVELGKAEAGEMVLAVVTEVPVQDLDAAAAAAPGAGAGGDATAAGAEAVHVLALVTELPAGVELPLVLSSPSPPLPDPANPNAAPTEIMVSPPPLPVSEPHDPRGAAIGAVLLGLALATTAVTYWLGVPVWLPVVVAAGCAAFCDVAYDCGWRWRRPSAGARPETAAEAEWRAWGVLRRLPWQVLPFLYGMFVISNGFARASWFARAASALGRLGGGSVWAAGFVAGPAAMLVMNLCNNQPGTILLTRLLQSPELKSRMTARCSSEVMRFAVVLASNYGALLTKFGALAGVLFGSVLAAHGQARIGFLEFLKFGAAVSVPTLLAALVVLCLEGRWMLHGQCEAVEG